MTAERQTEDPSSIGRTLILYDGVCGLCNRFVTFLLRHDRHDRFRFAPLQSAYARTLLQKHGMNPDSLDTVVVLTGSWRAERGVLTRFDALLFACRELEGMWRVSVLAKVLPHFVREWVYSLIARHRYQLFGKYDQCPHPSPQERHKFMT